MPAATTNSHDIYLAARRGHLFSCRPLAFHLSISILKADED